MADIKRVRVTLGGGGVVGPSVSTFYFSSGATGFVAALKTFYTAIVAGFPDDLTITVPNTGDILESTTGALGTSWTDGTQGTITGSSTQTFAKGAGMRVLWVTGGVRGGRRVHGTTFLVPLASVAFDSTGVVSTTHVSTVASAAATFLGSMGSSFLVWGKPHTKLSADGVTNTVTGVSVPNAATGLRSRRV